VLFDCISKEGDGIPLQSAASWCDDAIRFVAELDVERRNATLSRGNSREVLLPNVEDIPNHLVYF
jgi:hypothetical protein